MSRTVLHDDERGYVVAEGNELTIGSKIDDPPKVRVTAPTYAATGGGGGVHSFNRSRTAGEICWGSDQDEMGYVRVEQADSARGSMSSPKGELNVFLNTGMATDAGMERVFAMVWSGFTKWGSLALTSLRSWLNFSTSEAEYLRSNNARFRLHMQGDGNLVIYDDQTGAVLWNSGTVVA